MLATYAPLLAWLALVLAFVVGILALTAWIGRPQAATGKGDPYECGMIPRGDARHRFSVHYYLVAVLFILFDVEALFLILWALKARSLGLVGLVEVGLFLAVLAVGWLHIWRRGGLEWDR
ncbi:MAG: NADH-quinone oxidoreductase subunit A [Planctomycetota bacterium]|nr:MAG: NADH-quinone oxidoreductase subunit A [Planctomycetota bacterium]